MLLLILFCAIIPLDSPLMISLEYLQVRGLVETPLIKPYEFFAVTLEIQNLLVKDDFSRLDQKFISLWGPFAAKSSDFYTLYHLYGDVYYFSDYTYSGNISFMLSGRIINNVSYNQGLKFRFGSPIDSTGPKPWKDFAQGYLNEGNLRIANERIAFIVGRRNIFLGPADEYSLLLSPASEGYDGYLFLYNGKYYEFSTTFSILDIEEERFIATHRLGLKLNSFRLGFSEAILWGNRLEPVYINFFLPYYLSQWGIDKNDNIMWCFDGALNFMNTYLYGEFLIDDYQYSEPPPGYTEYPHKLAFQSGMKAIISDVFYFRLSYTFVDKWVYSHCIPQNIYQRDSICLGFPMGNDADRISILLRFLIPSGIFPKLNLEFYRKGEGSIFLPYEIERGPAYPPFPSGIVESCLTITPGLDLFYGSRWYFGIEGGKKYYKNFGHQTGNEKEGRIFNLKVFVLL
ncbi:MAG: hypothetical protein ABIL15_01465 [candidate division WOR-3 bacterium]